MLSWLGKFQKGRATVTGLMLAVLGGLGMTDTAQQMAGVSEQVGQVLTLAGTVLAAFGIGRKAGVAVK